MSRTYPQETMGITLSLQNEEEELRRVYMQRRTSYLEVGEITKGSLTQEVYGVPVHVHVIHLRMEDAEEQTRLFFAHKKAELSDYMDELDRRGVRYGYLNSMVDKYVSYRPAVLATHVRAT